MRKIIIPVLLMAAVAVTAVVYFSLNDQGNTDTIRLSGTIEAVEIDLSFKAPGRVTYVRFDEGEMVAAEDTVAELSHRESEARIRQADDQIAASRAQRKSLEIEKESLERNLLKVSNLVKSGGATLGDQEDLEDKVRGLEAAIAAANNTVKSLESQKDYLGVIYDDEFLLSPTKGTIILRAVEPGEIVSSGKVVLTIADLARLEIKVFLPEAMLGRIRIGQSVQIVVDSHPDRLFEGSVSRISDKAEFTPKNVQTKDERVKTVYAVTVSAGDHDGVLKPGMPCDVIIDLVP